MATASMPSSSSPASCAWRSVASGVVRAPVSVPITRVDPTVVERQRERLAKLRSRRDAGRAAKARTDLVTGAEGTANLVPLILAAVEVDVTLGEICADLRGVFGTYVPPRL